MRAALVAMLVPALSCSMNPGERPDRDETDDGLADDASRDAAVDPDGPRPRDAGGARDGGEAHDASLGDDGGGPDGRDAGLGDDGGPRDAGESLDAGGAPDAGATQDASEPRDAGAPEDAGPPRDADLGQPDAGTGTPDCSDRAAQPLDAVWTIQRAGATRYARVHIPATYHPRRRAPVVFNFHGYAMSGVRQAALSRLIAKSDTEGFIAVHPEGTGVLQGWNAGDCCGTAALGGADDVGFVDALLAELDERLCVDPKRIYATGFSNGGFLAHRLGCERADVFAAIASVAGVMGIDGCAPTRPVPVLHIHGTADLVVPYDGNLTFEPVARTIATWVDRNHCTAAPAESRDRGDVRCMTTAGCRAGAEVTLCTIDGGGHTWPGGGPFLGGYQTTDLIATDAIWEFFTAHPLP